MSSSPDIPTADYAVRAYRFRLRETRAQALQLARWSGQLRWIWNKALAEQQARRARGEPYANYVAMAKWLTAWRHAPETKWLAEGSSHPQQQTLIRLDQAFKRFFANLKAGRAPGYPRFKKRGDHPAIRFPDSKQFKLDAAGARIQLPKLGWLRLRLSMSVDGEIRNATVCREGSNWFVCIQTRRASVAPAGLEPTLGIDLGVAAFAADSNGTLVAPLKALARQQLRLKRYQRSVSRKKKGSANRRKAVAKLGNLHRRIARQRCDWLHKLTTDLADTHCVIAIEDLRIRNMSASSKGAVEAPGKNVKVKAGLNRSILDAAWGEFRRQLQYKCAGRGGEVIAVPPAYTSRTCRMCGHESAENRKSQSLFACVACGHTENADVHAAKNILAAGHAVWLAETTRQAAACGEDVRREVAAKQRRAASRKQEPTEALGCT